MGVTEEPMKSSHADPPSDCCGLVAQHYGDDRHRGSSGVDTPGKSCSPAADRAPLRRFDTWALSLMSRVCTARTILADVPG